MKVLAAVAVVLLFGVTAYTQGRAGGQGRGGQAPARAQTPWPPRLEVPARQVIEPRIGRAVDVDRILLPDDCGSSTRPMIERRRAPSLSRMRGGAMPTYAIHHYAALVPKATPRPKSARRIAMSARKASVVQRRTLRRAA